MTNLLPFYNYYFKCNIYLYMKNTQKLNFNFSTIKVKNFLIQDWITINKAFVR